MSINTPSYTHHKATNQARVRINGVSYYLGKWNSAESKERYRRLIAEYLSTGFIRDLSAPITVAELIERFIRDSEGKYQQRHFIKIQKTLELVLPLYGTLKAADFGPVKLKEIRKAMIGFGWCRTTINQRIRIVVKCFRFGVGEELIPASVGHALRELSKLERGKGVPEGEPVLPVAEHQIWPVVAVAPANIAAMIQVQLYTGMRTGEVCRLRGADITQDWPAEGIWSFQPKEHKTAHHGIEKVALIGPRAQRILTPFLEARLPGEYVFRPADSYPWDASKGHAKPLGECYGVPSYCRAVARACLSAGVAAWSPGQLRHNAASFLTAEFGIEIARIILGHQSIQTTYGYVLDDLTKAAEAMRKAG